MKKSIILKQNGFNSQNDQCLYGANRSRFDKHVHRHGFHLSLSGKKGGHIDHCYENCHSDNRNKTARKPFIAFFSDDSAKYQFIQTQIDIDTEHSVAMWCIFYVIIISISHQREIYIYRNNNSQTVNRVHERTHNSSVCVHFVYFILFFAHCTHTLRHMLARCRHRSFQLHRRRKSKRRRKRLNCDVAYIYNIFVYEQTHSHNSHEITRMARSERAQVFASAKRQKKETREKEKERVRA